jgi:hypothetical protein
MTDTEYERLDQMLVILEQAVELMRMELEQRKE